MSPAQEILTPILNVSPHLLWRRHCHTVTPEVKTTAAVLKLILCPLSVSSIDFASYQCVINYERDYEGPGLSGGNATQLVVCVFEQ